MPDRLPPGHVVARCPRCGAEFACGAAADRAHPCACTTIVLSAGALAQLRERHAGCLCLGCLRALADTSDTRTAP